MNKRTKILILGVGVCLSVWSAGNPVQAEDPDVNTQTVAPPMAVTAPPTMLYLAEPGVYVAVGIPYDIFFFSPRYYYFHAGYWYWGPGFNGPWIQARFRALPPRLRKYRIHQLQTFREREFAVYKSQGPRYNGRKFVGVGAPAKPRNEPMKGAHMREGMGRGRGHK